MMDFKVEYVQERNLSTLPWSAADRSTSVVRLAEVETLIQEAQWAMELISETYLSKDGVERARAFLDDLSAWRKRQEGA